MIDGLEGQTRVILKARLAPVIGSAFQPTGFPDLGPAEFERPLSADGVQSLQQALLVESVQSLANHFEGVAWDSTEDRPVATVARLPYVEVRNKAGRFLTSSRLEPHRLAGAYIKNATIDGKKAGGWMVGRLGVQKGVPLDWQTIYGSIFQLDPLCLIHGVFFSDPDWSGYGNPKVRRALAAVIEAHDVRAVVSGGVKRDDVYPKAGEGRDAKGGYGFVPFGRTQYTAAEIDLDIVLDLEQIRGYGLAEAETRLLTAVALWEVRTLLDRPLRLRTACDLEVVQPVTVRRPRSWQLPEAQELAREIESASVAFDSDGPYSTIFE
ncbi:MAG: type I-U CRISPR-associated RAMP protein Csb1/Cas7u [Actinomycetota bacterium]|nr:type I-U CRISPR-associated RAMP protein Csb1/Cas7u [Actinomycetota bacterium]